MVMSRTRQGMVCAEPESLIRIGTKQKPLCVLCAVQSSCKSKTFYVDFLHIGN